MVSSLPIFPDTQDHWASPFIQGLRSRNLVNGFSDGTFRPNQAMTRAEYATLVQRAFTQPKVRQYVPFVDVPSSFWAASAIQKAFEMGFMSGFPDKRFLPQEKITRVQVLVSLVGGLGLASTVNTASQISPLTEIYLDASQIPSYAKDAIAIATRAKVVVNSPNPRTLNPNQPATRGEVAAFIYQALVSIGQANAIASAYIVEVFPPGTIRQGTTVSVNGRSMSAAWSQWSNGAFPRTGITDTGLRQTLGVELLNTTDSTKQPGQWFSSSSNPLNLATRRDGVNRYLDITDWVSTAEWQIQINGSTLSLVTKIGNVENITFTEQSPGSRLVVDLNRPTPWQLSQQNQQWVVTIDALVDQAIVERFKPRPVEPPANPGDTAEERNEGETGGSNEKSLPPTVEKGNNQTIIRGNLPDGLSVRTSTLSNPNRLVVELRSDALVERDILWAKGLRWRQQYLSLGSTRFPVVWLTIDGRSSGLTIKPIWSNPTTMTGIAPLITIAQKSQVAAAINGGFFNRNNQLPLGAIRRENRWLSGAILNRGAIAWNDAGLFKIARLTLTETLITSTGQRLPLVLLNTGFVQRGIARYTPDWGTTYTPLTDNEILVIVQNNQVTSQTPGGAVGQTPITIPRDGYLLTLRVTPETASSLSVGTKVQLESTTIPAEFNQFPHILGGGPMLVQNQQVVLDAKAEGFSEAFNKQAAIRSAVGISASGELMIATIHNRIGGSGPTLAETSQLMQQLGAVEALNLDGGSSTSLALGGQLLNRAPSTAASVHNGLGIFLD
jgi:hypothetical protein